MALQQNPFDSRFYAVLMPESRFEKLANKAGQWDYHERMYEGYGPFGGDSYITLEVDPSIGVKVGDTLTLKLEFKGHSLIPSEQTRLSEP